MIVTLDDARLDPYRSLKTSKLNRRSGLFIAEGAKVVERLLASDFEAISILVSSGREQSLAPLLKPGIDLMVIRDRLASQLAGFKFHGGMMACGRRKSQPELAELAPGGLLVGCSAVDDPENLGSIIRLCAVFGAGGLLLGPGCADPFSRRVLRVSMGHAFRLPIRETEDLAADLECLRRDFGCRLIAAVPHHEAESLESAQRPERAIILFGNEAHGLGPELIDMCDLRLTIPMHSGADSLNVAVAAGIILYEFRRRAACEGSAGGHG